MHPGRPWLRTFLIIFTGQAFSLLGSAAVNFALVWWLTVETGSAVILAYASIAAILPQALLGPIAGPYVDRWDRRLTMIGADLGLAVTSIVLIVMFMGGAPSVAAVIVVIAVRSLGAAFQTPASQAAVPMYVPAEHLMRVSGWNFFLGSGVAMAGPVVGAFLMGVASMPVVIALDVIGAVLAIGSLLLVRIPHPEQEHDGSGRSGLLHEFREGWRELAEHRGLLELTLILPAVTLLWMPVNALFPLMTRAHFDGDAFAASLTELAFGAGMLVGSLAIGRFSARYSGVRLVVAGISLIGLTLALSGLLPSTAFAGFVVLCVAMGFLVPLFGAPLTAMFQLLIHPSRLGRVLSLYLTFAMLAAPAGLLIAGPLAQRVGVAVWFALAGVLIAVIGLVLWSRPAIRGLDRALAAASFATDTTPVAENEAQPESV